MTQHHLRFSRRDLIKRCGFNSGPSGLGTDYYVIYSAKSAPDCLIFNCYGVAAGWEFDRWELFSISTDEQASWLTIINRSDFAAQRHMIEAMMRVSVHIVDE